MCSAGVFTRSRTWHKVSATTSARRAPALAGSTSSAQARRGVL
jgi:hypothetical protein